MEAQRNHVLGKPHRESQGDEFEEYEEKQKSEPSEMDNGFEMLGADAELDQVIFDGSSFGTATPAGSDEEADYLGIPGLLDATQMRDLLRRRQEEQLDRRTAAGGTVPVVSTTHGQLRDLRRELNALVTLAHHRTGKPHGWIHNELRRICGGPGDRGGELRADSPRASRRCARCGVSFAAKPQESQRHRRAAGTCRRKAVSPVILLFGLTSSSWTPWHCAPPD